MAFDVRRYRFYLTAGCEGFPKKAPNVIDKSVKNTPHKNVITTNGISTPHATTNIQKLLRASVGERFGGTLLENGDPETRHNNIKNRVNENNIIKIDPKAILLLPLETTCPITITNIYFIFGILR